MPLKKARKGASKKARAKVVSGNIGEFHKGPRYASAVRKFGKAKANKIAVAVGISASKRGKRKKR